MRNNCTIIDFVLLEMLYYIVNHESGVYNKIVDVKLCPKPMIVTLEKWEV